MRILFALPGLHRYDRGAEIAFISLATKLATGGDEVTLIGSGLPLRSSPYRFLYAPSLTREYFEFLPSMPLLRSEYTYEELTFAPGLLRQYRPSDYDVTITCSYPFTNWMLRRPTLGAIRPPHVFVTQNGDWPAYAGNSEYRFFSCDGLICTNPDFYERNTSRWRCCLIPNGVDIDLFRPGAPRRQTFGLPADRLIVLMVSALIGSKRVDAGIEAVSKIPDAHLVVAGDGPLRSSLDASAACLLPGRFTRLTISSEQMPQLYRSADVLLHLSKDEPFGNVFIEAMACGLPVVGHNSERSRWIMGDDGYLVDTDDLTAVVQQIDRLRVSSSEEIKARVARAAKYSWSNVAHQYRDFIQEVITAYHSSYERTRS